MKRLFDLIVATLLLIITAPLLAIIAIVIKLDSRGPILYRRRCVGQNGQLFDLMRFRTMVETPAHRSVDGIGQRFRLAAPTSSVNFTAPLFAASV